MKLSHLCLPLAACFALGALPAPALAGDVPCPPNRGAATIDGNVVISGACTLEGTTVKGNVLLYAGGTLIARNARIEGSLQADRAVFVDVTDSWVNGDVQLDGLSGDLSRIAGTEVGGSIQLKDNRSPVEVLGNDVRADVQAFGNTGGVLIADNGVDGNLQCKSNAPAPVGGNNFVAGNKEDQCANLQPGGLPGGGPGGGSGGGGGTISGDVYCPPNIGAVTVDGNVLITSACRLDGTTVTGNVLLYAGGSLLARAIRVEGNIQAERADFVDVDASRVIGSVQLDGMVGDRSRVAGSDVGGNVQLVSNRSRLEVQGNGVGGDVQAFSNTGGVLIADNGIGGNLQCKSNNPAPAGGNNRVGGNREDQCANLQPESSPGSGSGSGSPAAGSSSSGSAAASASGGGGGGASGLLSLLAVLLALSLRPAGASPARRA
jgi:cytoskeletal protein CcmA (bactofilin family)